MRARYRSASPVSVESTTPLSFSSSLGSPAVPLNVTSPFNEDFAPVLSNGSVTFILQQSFVRGDCNADGMTALTDALALLDFLFAGGAAPGCGSACDFSGDEKISLGDVTYIALYLFLGGSTTSSAISGVWNHSCGGSVVRYSQRVRRALLASRSIGVAAEQRAVRGGRWLVADCVHRGS